MVEAVEDIGHRRSGRTCAEEVLEGWQVPVARRQIMYQRWETYRFQLCRLSAGLFDSCDLDMIGSVRWLYLDDADDIGVRPTPGIFEIGEY